MKRETKLKWQSVIIAAAMVVVTILAAVIGKFLGDLTSQFLPLWVALIVVFIISFLLGWFFYEIIKL